MSKKIEILVDITGSVNLQLLLSPLQSLQKEYSSPGQNATISFLSHGISKTGLLKDLDIEAYFDSIGAFGRGGGNNEIEIIKEFLKKNVDEFVMVSDFYMPRLEAGILDQYPETQFKFIGLEAEALHSFGTQIQHFSNVMLATSDNYSATQKALKEKELLHTVLSVAPQNKIKKEIKI